MKNRSGIVMFTFSSFVQSFIELWGSPTYLLSFIIHLIIHSFYVITIKYNMMVCTQDPGQQLKMGWRWQMARRPWLTQSWKSSPRPWGEVRSRSRSSLTCLAPPPTTIILIQPFSRPWIHIMVVICVVVSSSPVNIFSLFLHSWCLHVQLIKNIAPNTTSLGSISVLYIPLMPFHRSQ